MCRFYITFTPLLHLLHLAAFLTGAAPVAGAGTAQSACLLQGKLQKSVTSSVCAPPAPNATDYQLPADAPTVPFGKELMLLLGFFQAIEEEAAQFETSIAIHITSLIMTGVWNCAASYHDTWNDGLLPDRPVIDTTPSNLDGIELYTSEARTLCFLQGMPTLFSVLLPNGVAPVLGYLSQVGIPASTNHSFDVDIAGCMDLADEAARKSCLNGVVACNNWHPEVVGTIVMRYVLRYALNDGWNLDGSTGAKGRACTSNCHPYKDTTDYAPRNQPGSSWWWFWRQKYWQPLLEDDGRGYYFRQEHVTPHIGATAQGRVLSRKEIDGRRVRKPQYDYVKEGLLVVDRLRETATNDTLKMLVEFMDDKTGIARTVLGSLIQSFPQKMKIEDVALFFTGYLAAEHDAVVTVWKEKVRYDRVRTTTVIQQWGSYEINTFAGPKQGVQRFQAMDFQPYIRVMPHSEYPSGSSCICTAGYEFTTLWQERFLQDTTPLQSRLAFPAGSSRIEPGTTPQEDLLVILPNSLALRETCASTRLDGGMHFTASVPAGISLCEGIGEKAAQYVRRLVGNASLPLSAS